MPGEGNLRIGRDLRGSIEDVANLNLKNSNVRLGHRSYQKHLPLFVSLQVFIHMFFIPKAKVEGVSR